MMLGFTLQILLAVDEEEIKGEEEGRKRIIMVLVEGLNDATCGTVTMTWNHVRHAIET